MLEKLRSKPHHIKQSISLAVTIVIFSAILFVWVSSRDARMREMEVREKTVAPLDGVGAMFSGFVDGFKERMLSAPTTSKQTTTTDSFDLSGVVIIDSSSTTTKKK